MKTGTKIKTQIRRMAKAIQTRIDFVQQSARKGPAHVMQIDDPAAAQRRAALQRRYWRVVEYQQAVGLKPARRLMESANFKEGTQ